MTKDAYLALQTLGNAKRVKVIKTSPQKIMLILRLSTKKSCGLNCPFNFQLRSKKVGSPIKRFDTRIRLTLCPRLKHCFKNDVRFSSYIDA
jgi:hypothetical protein